MKLQSFEAAQSYHLARAALGPQKAPAQEPKQSGAAFEALHALSSVVEQGERASINYMAGGADPHSVVEAMAAAELAIETAVTVRDKVVEAYQELLRMPV
jgi:flagellar hook-basal body complex protein FliE